MHIDRTLQDDESSRVNVGLRYERWESQGSKCDSDRQSNTKPSAVFIFSFLPDN